MPLTRMIVNLIRSDLNLFIFPGENNTGLPPVPFQHHSPLHTLKVTDISVKLNRMQCKQSAFVS